MMLQKRDLIGELRRFFYHNHILADQHRLLLAVSGGRDSIALAHSLYLLNQRKGKKTQYQWQVMTIHHGLRGEQADSECQLVEQQCAKWQVQCHVAHLTPPQRYTAGMMDWARQQRYLLLEQKREELGYDYIMTAHHLNDHIETFFHKLLRGSAPSTLHGILAQHDFCLRPFLNVSRDDVNRFIKKHHLPTLEDPTNHDMCHSRSIIRHTLLPLLQKNPQLQFSFDKIKNFMTDIEQDNHFFDDICQGLIENGYRDKQIQPQQWQLSWLNELPLPLLRRIIWQLIMDIGISPQKMLRSHVVALCQLVKNHQDKSQVCLPEGYFAVKKGDFLYLQLKEIKN